MTITLHPGQTIDGFEVKRLLGRGGMGAVYLVTNPRIRADRAMKLISVGEISPSALRELEQRFANEAIAGAAMSHPNIVSVFDFKELTFGDERLVYLLMEYFPGVDLKVWLTRERPSLDRVLHVARQIAGALAHVHAAGILHRDIKLGNILIRPEDDHIKVADFGLAKKQFGGDQDDLTRTGVSIGTKPYFAPEYLRASQFDEDPQHTQLTDLWAVGIVLYYLATHHHPFEAPDNAVIVLKILGGKFLPVEARRSDISDEFAAVIEGLLAHDPANRTPSAKELLRQLNAITSPTDATKAPFSEIGPAIAKSTPVTSAMPVPPAGSATHNASSLLASSSSSVASSGGAPTADARARQNNAQNGDSIGEMQKALQAALPAQDASRGRPSSLPNIELPSVGIESNYQKPDAELSGFAALDAVIQGERQPSAVPPPRVSAPAPAPASFASPSSDHESDMSTPSMVPLSPPKYSAPAAPVKPRVNPLRAIVPAAIAATLVFGVGAVVLNAGDNLAKPKTKAAFVDPDDVRTKNSAANEMAELKRAQTEDLVVPTRLNPAPSTSAPPPAPPPPEEDAAPVAAQPKRTGKVVAAVETPPAPVAAAPATDAWAARYGSRNLNSGAVGKPSGDAATAATPTGAAAAAGTRIPVRVDVALASSPTSPVIAFTTQQMKLGAYDLPAGTQIHGRTAGTSGPRLLIQFQFALVGGKQITLRGQAIGLDGRAGIPGEKNLGGGSDVASGAVSGAVRGVGDQLAEAVGNNPGGDAIRGALDPAARKGGRLNNEEDVVSTKKGARFVIYIDDAR